MIKPIVASKFVNVAVRFSKQISFSRPFFCIFSNSSLSTSLDGNVWCRKHGWNQVVRNSRLPVFSHVYLNYSKDSKIDYSMVPVLCENELEEWFVKGSGPGGQNVNKRTNCCTLRHKPTGIIVKCHLSRVLDENRKLARKMMIEKLDGHFNGDNSLITQKERLQMKKSLIREQKSRKVMELKQRYKDLLRDSDNDEDRDTITGSSSSERTS